ncbi:hypothetical protein vseg_020920 [Gypsophila vaccaria]
MATVRRFHRTHLRSLISLACISPSSPIFHTTNFSHTFHPTPSSHSQLPNFSTFHPSSPHPPYHPINLHDFLADKTRETEPGTLQLLELVRKTEGFSSRKDALDFIVNSGVFVDADHVYFSIWALMEDWKSALLAFELAGKRGFVDHKMLSLIVWVLGKNQKFDIAWCLIREFHSVVDTRPAMLAVIDRYAAANCHEKAIKTFGFLEKLSVSPDQNTLYSLLSALCKYGNVEEAEEFMLKNRKMFPLETEGFNIILHAWCTISVDIFEAKRVWREMASNCITPDTISYTHMISCFSRDGNLFDSLRLYDEMKKRGWVPGLEVYNSLMYAMVRENCLNEALKLLEKVKEMGLQPDSSSYNCLICPLCEAGKFEEARGLLFTMSQDSIAPTLETYKALLANGNLDSTLDILQKMKNDKVGPDGCTFLLIFDRFFKLRQPENVLKIWVEMKFFGVNPESTHYSSLICGLANCGCLIKAKEMHTEMIANGFVDDPKLKKLLQEQETRSHQGSIGPTHWNHIDRRKIPSAFHTSPRRGKKKRGIKS